VAGGRAPAAPRWRGAGSRRRAAARTTPLRALRPERARRGPLCGAPAAVGIGDYLASKGIKKAAVTKALDALAAAGKLTAKVRRRAHVGACGRMGEHACMTHGPACRPRLNLGGAHFHRRTTQEFGKTKIFLPPQEGLQVLSKEVRGGRPRPGGGAAGPSARGHRARRRAVRERPRSPAPSALRGRPPTPALWYAPCRLASPPPQELDAKKAELRAAQEELAEEQRALREQEEGEPRPPARGRGRERGQRCARRPRVHRPAAPLVSGPQRRGAPSSDTRAPARPAPSAARLGDEPHRGAAAAAGRGAEGQGRKRKTG
jgi:hypothetical protein